METKKNISAPAGESEKIRGEGLEECKIKCETEKHECKIECAADDEHEYKIGNATGRHDKRIHLSSLPVWTILIVLIFLNVIIVVYATYEIIHLSGVSNLSGIHATPSMEKAADFLLNRK